jgi:hypothetical protein
VSRKSRRVIGLLDFKDDRNAGRRLRVTQVNLPNSAGSLRLSAALIHEAKGRMRATSMETREAGVTAWADVLDRVIPLLRDAKKDCEVDCGPMALGKIDQAIRLLTAARQGERNRNRSDTPTRVGAKRMA